ncbi:MAG: IS66 family insertion sequence element accessory protein TnpB [Moritella sp.]|uniref:IS66 family insertion sequence element accessory protein TnpA n=1 Tax=Moritella sp. TaxID=78556 RepID=UPI001D531460|nr:IS66 family insertion sequence element accessory protein TnpB [Moritella sp.]NQZ52502.1 IS66 family insertion sequence element accessory protein TnpB [Moritella sp.]
MRTTRSQEQWQTIIEDQQTSGLTIIEYCQQQQLTTSSFYAVRKKFNLSSGNFVRAKITQQVELIEEKTFITVTVGKANVSLPASTSVTYLSLLLRELI